MKTFLKAVSGWINDHPAAIGALIIILALAFGAWVWYGNDVWAKTYTLSETPLELTWNGQAVENAAVLDLKEDGLMIFIDYDPGHPVLILADGTTVALDQALLH